MKAKHSSYNSYYGDYTASRVAKAVAKKSWRWTFLNLAWTAGPVTFIALYIGHHFGYGGMPAFSTFVYFAIYTAVVGLFGAIVTTVRDAIYLPKIEKEKVTLIEAIDRTFNLILHIRDLNLCSLPPEERKIMAAYYTLQTAGCSPSAVKEAVYDLTSSRKLANAIQRVSALNEQGMQALVDDTWKLHKVELEQAEERLKKIAPVTYDLLVRRMKGESPQIRKGRPRDQGFIERVLDAADESDTELMTLTDAYEMTTLVFELLNGRQITSLQIAFKGDKAIEKAKRLLDNTRKRYKKLIRDRNNSIRLILDSIESEGLIELLPESANSGPLIIQKLISGLSQLKPREQQKYRKEYEEIRQLHVEAQKAKENLTKAKNLYLEVAHKWGETLSLDLENPHVKSRGFYIQKSVFDIEDDMKLKLAHAINETVSEDSNSYTEEQAKKIAMELGSTLDQFLQISNMNTQIAIENSNAMQLGHLKPAFTPATKVGWAQTVVKSMQENSRTAAHLLAKKLTTFYEIPLTDHSIDLLVDEFGADPAYLQKLQKKGSQPTPKAKQQAEFKELPAWSTIFTSQA